MDDLLQFLSPLRYPGGKGSLSPVMKNIIETNLLYDGTYIEPYAGGAGIALDLLYNEYMKIVLINDLDFSIFAFWYSVLNNPNELCKMIREIKVDVKNWKKQKKVQLNKNKHTILDVGFSTFFLNRTNRSGILNGGIIGGYNQNGTWKINARFNKDDLIKRILKASNYRHRIELYNLDAGKFILKMRKSLPTNSLLYIDPPYYIKGKDLYKHHYIHKDHVSISKIIKNIKKQNWIVTYDNVPQISELYKENRQIQYSLYYSAAIKQKGTELMIFGDRLAIPKNLSIIK